MAAVLSLGLWPVEIHSAFGLPAHPLLIHVPVVFVPILGLAALAVIVRPAGSSAPAAGRRVLGGHAGGDAPRGRGRRGVPGGARARLPGAARRPDAHDHADAGSALRLAMVS